MGYQDVAALDSMATRFRPWLLERMQRGGYLAWLATAPDGQIVAGGGLWIMAWPPHMVGSGPRGNILNVYTDSQFRRKGLAGELVKTAIQWCRDNCVDTIILHASPDGLRLYESLGFARTNEMRIQL